MTASKTNATNRRAIAACRPIVLVLHSIGQRAMARLAVEIGLAEAQALGGQLVVRGVVRRQQRVNARLQQAGVDLRPDRQERAAAGRQKQPAWQETERIRE